MSAGAVTASPWAGGSARSSIGTMVASVPSDPAVEAAADAAGVDAVQMSDADRCVANARSCRCKGTWIRVSRQEV